MATALSANRSSTNSSATGSVVAATSSASSRSLVSLSSKSRREDRSLRSSRRGSMSGSSKNLVSTLKRFFCSVKCHFQRRVAGNTGIKEQFIIKVAVGPAATHYTFRQRSICCKLFLLLLKEQDLHISSFCFLAKSSSKCRLSPAARADNDRTDIQERFGCCL